MDEIAVKIKEGCSSELRQWGVLLHASRIVNFEFPEKEVPRERDNGLADNVETNLIQGKLQEGQIEQKQIFAWSADWQREAAQTRAEGKAHADLLMQEARAYAYTKLLTAFAEGLEEARLLDPKLPRYVIGIRFIGALEQLIGQQPDAQSLSDVRNSLNQLKKMMPWATDGE
jgi:regulator of protease activity HflC (stomatin/prohibitin superfamily)